eukprot:g66329.t1
MKKGIFLLLLTYLFGTEGNTDILEACAGELSAHQGQWVTCPMCACLEVVAPQGLEEYCDTIGKFVKCKLLYTGDTQEIGWRLRPTALLNSLLVCTLLCSLGGICSCCYLTYRFCWEKPDPNEGYNRRWRAAPSGPQPTSSQPFGWLYPQRGKADADSGNLQQTSYQPPAPIDNPSQRFLQEGPGHLDFEVGHQSSNL